MVRLLATCFVVLIGVATSPQPQAQQPKVSEDIEDLLWWLPPDTETVEVTQTPADPRGPLFDVMGHTQGEIVSGDVSYGETLTRHLKGRRIKATVEGSRVFRPPSGLGAMLYEGAVFIRFEKPLGETATRLMADLGTRALKVDHVDGLTVVEFRDKLEDDLWTSCITMPAADLLVIATNRSYLEEVLRRRKGRTAPRALPGALPEWQRIDVSAPYWAVRHYRRDGGEDPTSPFARRNVIGGFDDHATGVTAHVNADGRTIVAHYLSSSSTAEAIARRMWDRPGDGVSPAFQRVGSDAVEVRFVAKDEEDMAMFFFYLMAALGHATYL